MNRVSVIVPAYNEGSRIEKNLLRIEKSMSKFSKNYEIICVNDGSIDDTFRNAKKAGGRYIKVVGYGANRGKGAAIKYGYSFVKGDVVVFLDSDLEIDPSNIKILLDAIGKGADVAIFSKNHPLSETDFPLVRHVLSRMFYALTKMLFRLPVSDTQTGCKAFRRRVLDRVFPPVYTRAFAFDLELLSYANDFGCKIVEFPIKVCFGREGSRLTLRNVFRMFLDTLIAFHRLNIKKIHRWNLFWRGVKI